MNSPIISFLYIFLLMAPALAFGGVNEDENKSTLHDGKNSMQHNSIYSVGNEKDTKPSITNNDPLDVLSSNSNILRGEDSLAILNIDEGEPMVRFKEELNPEQKHAHQVKQTVEKATHEFVSSQAKGYKVALGITIITGLAFLGLSVFKIGEGNNKNLSNH